MIRCRTILCLAFGLLIVFVLSGCRTQETTPSKNELTAPADIKDIYMNHCSNCHGDHMQGSFGPSLVKVGSKYNKEQILNIIHKGKGSMPSQDYVPKAEQEKLAEWLSKQK